MTAYWPAPAPTPAPPGLRRRRWIAGIALADALVLVASVTSYVDRSDRPAPQPRDIASVVAELSDFVEEQRGLDFLSPVDVTLLDDAQFRARLASEEDTTDAADPEPDAAATLQALGLVPPGTDVEAAIDELTGDSVAGFYDPEADELVVRGDRATPLVRAVLVHELTHALQDQHFDLHRPELAERDDESHLGFLGLVEGDANVVEEAYRDDLSDDDQDALEAEEQRTYGGAGAGAPDVLVALLGFPYQAGPQFVGAVLDARGQEGLDAAFERPPASSEHLLHVRAYLERDDPVPVAAPRARGGVVDQGVLGELGLLLTLGIGGRRDIGEVLDDVDGWGGDRYVTWRDGVLACTAAAIVMDDDEAAGELRDALRAWAVARPRTSVGGTGTGVTLDACA